MVISGQALYFVTLALVYVWNWDWNAVNAVQHDAGSCKGAVSLQQ